MPSPTCIGRGGHREESQNDSASPSNEDPSVTSEIEERINPLQAEVEAKDIKIAVLEKLFNSQQETIEVKDAKMAEQNSITSDLNNEVESLKNELQSKSADNEILQNELNYMKSSLQEANATIASFNKKNQSLAKSVDTMAETTKNEMNELKSINSSLQELIGEKVLKIVELQGKNSSLQAEIKDKNTKMAVQNSLTSNLKNQGESKSVEIKKLQKRLVQYEEDIRTLRTETESVSGEHSLFWNKLARMERELEEYKEYKEKAARVDSTAISAAASEKIEEKESELSAVRAELDRLKRESDQHIGVPNPLNPTDMQSCFLQEVQLGEELMAAGNLEEGAEHIANAVIICGQGSQLLSIFQQTLPPDHFALVLEKLPSARQRLSERLASASDILKQAANEGPIVATSFKGVKHIRALENRLREVDQLLNSQQTAAAAADTPTFSRSARHHAQSQSRVAPSSMNIYKATIRGKFTEISKLTFEDVYSQPTNLDGIDWQLGVYNYDDNLVIHLKGQKPNGDKWSCPVSCEIQLISQKNEKVVHRMGQDAYYFSNSKPHIHLACTSFTDLFDRDKGFVKDDSIVLSVSMKFIPTNKM